MNIQHSSRSDSWGTPLEILDMVREVFGGQIFLDPCSSSWHQQTVRAYAYFTKENDGLSRMWSGSVYCNPPGGKVRNRSQTVLFWEKLLREIASGRVDHAIFMGFSLEALQTTQRSPEGILEFPFCIPARRIRFEDEHNDHLKAPTHSNVIVYVSGNLDRTADFVRVFARLGQVCYGQKVTSKENL